MENNKAIEVLFQRYLNNECTPQEIRLLLQHFAAGENEELLRSLIREQSETNASEHLPSGDAMDYLLDATFRKIKTATSEQATPAPIVPLYRRTWFRVAAAAVFLLMSATAVLLFRQKEHAEIAQTKRIVQAVADILPGRNNATLTLSDKTTIMLDSAANGALAREGDNSILKMNGQTSYAKTGKADATAAPVYVYNTLATAKGNQYQLVLADGSKVWLNAASSIRFPASFTGNERRVEITGEVYFEITKDKTKPFRVAINTQAGNIGEIEVFGTHFNVNAYSEEPEIQTTLIEGSVKVRSARATQMLSPGEQASFTSDGIKLEKNVDLSQVVAWKDGYFLFNNTDIHTLMRQVARWYDVDVSFEGKITEDGFTGKISRNVPLSGLLKVLELNDVQVKTEGRKILVKP